MIVNDRKGQWEIIFQRNHALLAGKIALALKPVLRPPHWPETLLSIMDHDDGQNDLGRVEHITEEGYPKSFRAYDFHLEQAERVVSIARRKSQWIFLLISMHAHAIRKDVEPKTEELRCFLDAQLAHQKRLRNYFGISESDADKAYLFLRWCDECSLILCENRLDTSGKCEQIGEIPGIGPVEICRISDTEYAVSPWCFSENRCDISAETYLLTEQTFLSSRALKEALNRMLPTQKKYILTARTG